MKLSIYSLSLLICILCFSCSEEEQVQDINLKWNKAYVEDTFERSSIGLKWALSYLGATTFTNQSIRFNDSIISINPFQLGLSKNGANNLERLHVIFKNSEAYKKNKSLDLGRYVALTFGNSYHYYAITDVPKNLEQFKELYIFDSLKGYIDNSSVSKVDRVISFSSLKEKHNQAFISAEIDSITKDTLEYETVERMPNGQLKFGIYDINGKLKDAANSDITRAGKPAKCIWCHEVVVQPIFRTQQNHTGFLTYKKFNDTLKYFNRNLQDYQDSKWKDKNLRNKKLHTELELLYISFMEPTAERIAREWNMPLDNVKQKLSHLNSHTYEEFPFLGNLYHRQDIDALSPIGRLEVPERIRERSNNEINLLD